MKINSINAITFNSKKFRLPVTIIENETLASFSSTSVNKYTVITDRFVKEFSNPNAEKLYKASQVVSTCKEKMKFLEQMGDFKIIDLEHEKKVKEFLKGIDNWEQNV